MKIQIVEDEGVVALDIRRHLEAFGYSVTGVHSSGEEAISVFERESPDLVLMDIRLQGKMDGIEAAQIIRERYSVPVIILTAYADEKTIERAKLTEPFGYIIKPFEERELRTNIEMAFFRHSLEKKLQLSEERYRRFFEDDLSADFVADPSGILIECNHAFVNYFGFQYAAEAHGTNISERFLNEDQADRFWTDLYKEGRLEFYELEMARVDGSQISLLANVVADPNEDGTISEIKGYLIDISKRKKLEQQLRQAQKLEAIGRLEGGVAHDFNNILTVILGYSTILKEKMDRPESVYESEVKGIEEAAKRASSLTRQLLAFSRRQVLKPKLVKLNELIHNIEKMMSRLITEEITLLHSLDADPDTVWIDPSQVEQVIMNLVVNARDALPEGGTIRVMTANTNILSPVPSPMGEIPPGEYVCIVVRDNGHGIEPQLLKMIFEPFFTTKEEERGTGLGLSTVYGIVKQSSGYLQVESSPGEGSTFTVFLPKSNAKKEGEDEGWKSDEELHGNEKIMVVEDEKNLRQLAKKILTLYGYRVTTASTAEQALKIFEDPDEIYDILITDVVMPKIGGEELVHKTRILRPEIKVLYMSGYPQRASSSESNMKQDIRLTPFIEKPFSPEQFARKVRNILDAYE